MKFDYKRYGDALRPVIPITLCNGDTELGYHVLVDSGADMCIFDSGMADALGINWKKGKKKEIFGVGGKACVIYGLPMTIKVGGWSYDIGAYFMPDVSGRRSIYGIVGQVGFFDNFAVKFDLLKEEVDLKRKE